MGQWTIVRTPGFEKKLRRLPQHVQPRVNRKLCSLAVQPRPVGGTKLKKDANRYRLRIGTWRLIDEIQDDQRIVFAVSIVARKEAYRRRH
ncbi:MAG: type II toxin-antitoxin system RelE/ParE family toxin [Anaerolineales bacterium]|nr:type II toxin-antitoxin system RelE/ParE family toxin [Anaerolineales bacterium]